MKMHGSEVNQWGACRKHGRMGEIRVLEGEGGKGFLAKERGVNLGKFGVGSMKRNYMRRLKGGGSRGRFT